MTIFIFIVLLYLSIAVVAGRIFFLYDQPYPDAFFSGIAGWFWPVLLLLYGGWLLLRLMDKIMASYLWPRIDSYLKSIVKKLP